MRKLRAGRLSYRAAGVVDPAPGRAELAELAAPASDRRLDDALSRSGATTTPGSQRIARERWSLTESPPLTEGSRASGSRWEGKAFPYFFSGRTLAAAETAFGRGQPQCHAPPVELDPEHPRMTGCRRSLRVHFLGLRRFPERFARWLSEDRTVALDDVLARLEPA